MANATDIITYVGIPLAVLGVLPILYTFLLAILNQRRIRRALTHHGHSPLTSSKLKQDGFMIRSSPMTTLIEVELPKYAIAPLERHDERYWKPSDEGVAGQKDHDHLLARAESTLSTIEEGRVQGYLRGGSWRAFQWKKLIVGKKLYRIQYVDELREPPAEIDFADLIHFLLDWGAELDPMGWEKLRSGGLWTPAGTVLLRLSDEADNKGHLDWVLRTSMPDESDGILSLCIRWPSSCDDVGMTRGAKSLPPGWGRLHQPEISTYTEGSEEESKKCLSARITEIQSSQDTTLKTSSLRLKIESGTISTTYLEHDNIETGTTINLTHLSRHIRGQAWFTTATSFLLLTKPGTNSASDGALWGFEAPLDLTTFARKETIPVGVLVLLGLLDHDRAPQWTSQAQHDYADTGLQMLRRLQARQAAERAEASMPPEQARITKSNREAAETRRMLDDAIERSRQTREREERKTQDAIVSTRMENRAVAQMCLDFLKAKNEIGPEWTIWNVTEAILYLLVLDQGEDDQSEAFRILKVLDEWIGWSNVGGMTKEHLSMLQKHQVEFCFAVCVVAVVQEGTLSSQTKGRGKASVDMLDCINLWRKVRLG